ncbi:MAG: glycosyltransferase family 1 protein [Campylobacterales bacterium]|nr:glycosyltransferase family 1 protein [Campylobacterales bacterium]
MDVTRLVGRFFKRKLPTGIDRVCLAYVERYGDKSCALIRIGDKYHIVGKSISQEIFTLLLCPENAKHTHMIWLLLRSFFTLNSSPTRGKIMFNIGHMGLDREEYPHVIKKMEVKPIFMVHDLIPIHYPEYGRVGEKERHIRRINCVLDTATAIVTNSQATLNELRVYSDAQNKPTPYAIAALLGTLVLTKEQCNAPLKVPYFVILGTIEGRKNHLLLLNIWRNLVDTLGDETPILVIIGQRGWECENVIDLLDRCDKLKNYVIEIPRCSDEMLSAYLHHTCALLFPSFVEGYGMPLAEALSIGVPVLASDLGVFREIAGDIPEYIDSLDGKRWKEMIIEYARSNSSKRQDQIERIKKLELPTWEYHFNQVDNLITLMVSK